LSGQVEDKPRLLPMDLENLHIPSNLILLTGGFYYKEGKGKSLIGLAHQPDHQVTSSGLSEGLLFPVSITSQKQRGPTL